MRSPLTTRRLPDRPDLDQLRRQAKELLAGFLERQSRVIAEVNLFYRDADPAKFALHDAQLVLARSYGFESWPKLKAFVDGMTIGRLIDTVRAGDVDQVAAMLRVRPELVTREAPKSQGLTALHYAVMERMPEMVRTLMRFGANPHVTTAGIYALRDAATPRTIAVERGYDDIAAIIREEEKLRSRVRQQQAIRRPSFGGRLRAAMKIRRLSFWSGIAIWPICDCPIAGGRHCTLHRPCCCRGSRSGCWIMART